MKQIPVQADGITALSATDFNQIPREEENAILSSGQILTETDVEQLSKCIAVYAGQGDFYTDTGFSNTYVLAVLGSQKSPPTYTIGMTIRFKPNFSNNSTACTVNVAGLGAVSINVGQLANGGTPTVENGRITPNKIYTMVYDQTSDTLTQYFRIDQIQNIELEDVSLSKLSAGSADISVGNDNLKIDADRVTIENTSTGASTTIRAGSGSENALVYAGGVGYRQTSIANDGVTILDPQGTAYRPETLITGKGLSFTGGPGIYDVLSMRMTGFDASSLLWTVDPFTARIFYSGTDLTLTGIPWGSTIHGCTLSFADTGGRIISSAVTCTFKDVAGVTTLDFTVYLGGTDPTGGSSYRLWVNYNSASVD